MSPRTSRQSSGPGRVEESAGATVNEVRLLGRLSGDPRPRDLPSGDEVLTFRVVVPREDGRVDTLDCAAWRASLRRTIVRWTDGDVIEVRGALRRRFWRAGTAVQSRTEIEVTTARRITRSP